MFEVGAFLHSRQRGRKPLLTIRPTVLGPVVVAIVAEMARVLKSGIRLVLLPLRFKRVLGWFGVSVFLRNHYLVLVTIKAQKAIKLAFFVVVLLTQMKGTLKRNRTYTANPAQTQSRKLSEMLGTGISFAQHIGMYRSPPRRS